jgi:hypothetical protein
MADVLKVVSPRIQKTSLGGDSLQPSFQPQGPAFGNIVAELSDGGETRAVLWSSDAVINDVLADDVAGLNLDVIEDADAATVDTFEGTVVLRIAPGGPVVSGSAVLDAAGGTSREFKGTVVAIYRRTPIEAQAGSGDEFLLMRCINDGMYLEDLSSQFTVLKNY